MIICYVNHTFIRMAYVSILFGATAHGDWTFSCRVL